MEADALIRTKLIPPTLSPDILSRPQLIERLENGHHRKLTLISAPVGYGKSILDTLTDNPLQYSKAEILALVDELLEKLEASS